MTEHFGEGISDSANDFSHVWMSFTRLTAAADWRPVK